VLAVLLALGACAAAAPSASAAIVFECADNLCRINADGSGRAQLTSDGTPTNDYHWPSLSRDGTRMSWIRHGGLYLGTPAGTTGAAAMTNLASFQVLRPDGGQVAALEWGAFPGLYVYVHNADGSLVLNGVRPDDPAIGWAPDGRLLLPWSISDPTPATAICAVSADTTRCETRLAYDPPSQLTGPAVSPDGRLLAAIAKAAAADSAGAVVLYDMVTHARVRALTNGPRDSNVAWSPDGSRLVFQRELSLYTIGVGEAPGAERLLTAGETPSWGGVEPAAPTPAGPTPAPTPAPFRASSAFRLPSAARCLRPRATLTVAYRRPRDITITRVEVRIGQRTLVRRTGSGARRSIRLRRLPARRFTLTLRVTRDATTTATARRTYRVCAR
jgi:hypothetical protein